MYLFLDKWHGLHIHHFPLVSLPAAAPLKHSADAILERAACARSTLDQSTPPPLLNCQLIPLVVVRVCKFEDRCGSRFIIAELKRKVILPPPQIFHQPSTRINTTQTDLNRPEAQLSRLHS